MLFLSKTLFTIINSEVTCPFQRKVVRWDYDQLYQLIFNLTCRRKFPHNVTVTYPKTNTKVKVMTDYLYGKFSHTFGGKLLAFVTVIAMPILWLYRKRFKNLQIQFQMDISSSEWFENNSSDLKQYIQTNHLKGRIVSWSATIVKKKCYSTIHFLKYAFLNNYYFCNSRYIIFITYTYMLSVYDQINISYKCYWKMLLNRFHSCLKASYIKMY